MKERVRALRELSIFSKADLNFDEEVLACTWGNLYNKAVVLVTASSAECASVTSTACGGGLVTNPGLSAN